MHLTKIGLLSICFGLLSICLLLLGTGPASAHDVVVFGDSWAAGAADELSTTFFLRGRSDITVDGVGVGGTTADYWANSALNALPDAVSLNPDAQWVWLSIGGNDLFAHYAAGQGAQAAADLDINLRMMLDALFAVHPNIKVVMFGYDYINFEQSAECIVTALNYFGAGVTTPFVNQVFLNDVVAVQQAVAADYPNLTYVDSVLGTLQQAGNVPGAPNSLLPSPSEYMADCIHPTSFGYALIMSALYDAYWALPAPTAAFNTQDNAWCFGDTATYTATGSGEPHWYLDGQYVGMGATLQVLMDAPGPRNLELRVNNGAWQDSLSTSIEVHDAPTAAAGADVSICAGESTLLGAVGDGVSTYSWSPVSGLDTPNQAQCNASPTQSTEYTLLVDGVGGCMAGDSVMVTVLPAPEFGVQGPFEVQAGESVSYRLAPVPDAALEWWASGEAEITVGVDGAEILWPEAGDFMIRVSAEDASGCNFEAILDVQVLPADEQKQPDDDDSNDDVEPGCSCSAMEPGARMPSFLLIFLVTPLFFLRR